MQTLSRLAPAVIAIAALFLLFEHAPNIARYLIGWLAFVIIGFLIWAFAMNVTWRDLGPNPPDWEDDWPDHQ